MDKKIIRIFEPSVAMCFVVMLMFSVVTFLFNEYTLAAVEAGIVLILFVYHILLSNKRKKELQKYIVSTTTSRDSAMASGVPFPMAIIRIDTDEIMWANKLFQAATNLTKSVFNAKMADIIPSFSSLWILDGKRNTPGKSIWGAGVTGSTAICSVPRAPMPDTSWASSTFWTRPICWMYRMNMSVPAPWWQTSLSTTTTN